MLVIGGYSVLSATHLSTVLPFVSSYDTVPTIPVTMMIVTFYLSQGRCLSVCLLVSNFAQKLAEVCTVPVLLVYFRAI